MRIHFRDGDLFHLMHLYNPIYIYITRTHTHILYMYIYMAKLVGDGLLNWVCYAYKSMADSF